MSADPANFFNSSNINISEGQQQSSTSSSGPGKAILEVAIIVSIAAIIGIIARAAIRWHCGIDKRCGKCLDGDIETPQQIQTAASTTSQRIQQHASSSITATTTPTTGQPPAPPTAQPPAPPTAQPPPPPTIQPTIQPHASFFVVPNPPHCCTGAPHILPAANVHPLYTYPVAYYSSCRCQRCCREE